MRDSYAGLFDDARIEFLSRNAEGLVPRTTEVGPALAKAWRDAPDSRVPIWTPVKALLPATTIEAIRSIPDRLFQHGEAATWTSIRPQLPEHAHIADRELRRSLQYTYFRIYMKEFRLVVLRSVPLMLDDFGLASDAAVCDYKRFTDVLHRLRIRDLLIHASADTILRLRQQHEFIRFVDAYAAMGRLSKTSADLVFAFSSAIERSRFDWARFAAQWPNLPFNFERNLNDAEMSELAQALGGIASTIQASYGLQLSRVAPSRKLADVHRSTSVRTEVRSMPELVIFVALEEELRVLVDRWDLKRNPRGPAAEGQMGGEDIHVLCPMAMRAI